ncbi:MAG: hypothetical protein HQM15_07155 [Deltaproteobacteria bacterium]|nr:hypothetical protein [Deltaproteobacteria bacterium]
MTLNISNLNLNLLANSILNPSSSSQQQNAASSWVIDPNAGTSTDPNSALSSSLLGSTDPNATDNSLLFTPLLSISNTAQILSKRQNSISKTLTEVTDNASLVQTAQGGLSQVNNLLNSLKNLLTQAESSTLSSQERTTIDQNIKSTLENYTQLIDSTQYSGQQLFSNEKTIFVNTSDTDSENKAQIHLPNLSAQALGLDQLDASSPQKVLQSLNILNKAFFTSNSASLQLQNVSSQLSTASDSLQKALQSILQFQSITSSSASALAQSMQPSDLSQTQNTSSLANIAPSLL